MFLRLSNPQQHDPQQHQRSERHEKPEQQHQSKRQVQQEAAVFNLWKHPKAGVAIEGGEYRRYDDYCNENVERKTEFERKPKGNNEQRGEHRQSQHGHRQPPA